MESPLSKRLADLFQHFFESERSAGFALFFCAILSLILANTAIGSGYSEFWRRSLTLPLFGMEFSIIHGINDGLMTVFFLLVGLEIEREIIVGELSGPRKALLPIIAAIGGMVVPIGLYSLLNVDRETASGFGIPMATDIAFAIGVLSLVGSRAPLSLKIFLTALAIIDDLGAIIVISLFYTDSILWKYLLLASILYAGLLLMNRLKVSRISLYLIPGMALWYFIHKAGIHPSISGVFLAFAIPFECCDRTNPSFILQDRLHRTVPFLVLPLFALANTAIVLPVHLTPVFLSRTSLAIMAGLILGKFLGIFLFTFISVKTGLCLLPRELNWRLIAGVALLGGIGFTMSMFITNLAFKREEILIASKLSVLAASAVAAVLGLSVLFSGKPKDVSTPESG